MRRGPLGANVAAERRVASSSGQKSKRPAVSRPRVRRKRFARLPSGIFLSWRKNMPARSYVSLIEEEEMEMFLRVCMWPVANWRPVPCLSW